MSKKINLLMAAILVLILLLLLLRCTVVSPKMGDRIVLEKRTTDTLMVVGGKFKEGVFYYTVRYVRKNGTWYEYEVSKNEKMLVVK